MEKHDQTEYYHFNNRLEYYKKLDESLPDKYVKTRNLGAGKIQKYIPIPIKEAVADFMFLEWNTIDEQKSQVANELIVTVKIMYVPSYPGATEQICTGTGTAPIQMDKDSNVDDFPSRKKINAMEYCYPNAKSKAIGDALEHLGNIFGRNVDRKISKTESVPTNFSFRKYE